MYVVIVISITSNLISLNSHLIIFNFYNKNKTSYPFIFITR